MVEEGEEGFQRDCCVSSVAPSSSVLLANPNLGILFCGVRNVRDDSRTDGQNTG